jgi:putative spermidine/putrescine transport system substrate-binding protein
MAAAAAVTGSLLLTVGCSSSNSSTGSASGNTGSGTDWATASSVAAGGGMNALVAAAKKEGTLNVITLPANYGTSMKDFTAKYGIKINDANPDGSSQDELNAVNQLKGQDRAPDVLDMGTAFAVKGAQQGIAVSLPAQPVLAAARRVS